jgi:hypothetical protein
VSIDSTTGVKYGGRLAFQFSIFWFTKSSLLNSVRISSTSAAVSFSHAAMMFAILASKFSNPSSGYVSDIKRQETLSVRLSDKQSHSSSPKIVFSAADIARIMSNPRTYFASTLDGELFDL